MTDFLFNPAFLLGLFGLSGATLFWPVMARLIAGPRTSVSSSTAQQAKRIAILIPAHNEALTLQRSLRSVISSVEYCKAEYPHLTIDVSVGADGCTDKTSAIAENCGVCAVPSQKREGKWKTLTRLIEQHQNYDWVALVDSGTLWPKDLLFQILPLLSNAKCMGIAPSYRDKKSGRVAAGLWWIERRIKVIESHLGGPVTTHGATTFYRVGELWQAIEILKGSQWRNDDVVIPLVMRTLYPEKEILYCTDISVFEGSPEASASSFPRRRRVLLGNLEWIAVLFPAIFSGNKVVAFLALRRVFRVFWAYWILLIITPVALITFSLPVLISLTVSASIGALYYSSTARVLASAAAASMLAPFYFLTERALSDGRWR